MQYMRNTRWNHLDSQMQSKSILYVLKSPAFRRTPLGYNISIQKSGEIVLFVNCLKKTYDFDASNNIHTSNCFRMKRENSIMD